MRRRAEGWNRKEELTGLKTKETPGHYRPFYSCWTKRSTAKKPHGNLTTGLLSLYGVTKKKIVTDIFLIAGFRTLYDEFRIVITFTGLLSKPWL
jgi:hypothetical protein